MFRGTLERATAWSALATVVLLQGCAAPGFDRGGGDERTIPITPELVQAQMQAQPRTLPPAVERLFAEPQPYTIGPNDVLGIIVYDHPELLHAAGAVISQQADPTGIPAPPGFIVSAGGEVTFPYVGRVMVAGLTEIEASELFTQRLAKYIKNPQVTVRMQSFRSRRAYVDGDVRNPGPQIFTDVPMTLPEAINRAGGISPAGDRANVHLTRNNETTIVNLALLQELGVNPNRILLQPGDMVTVRNRDESKVYVMGEVARPSGVPMHGGRLSLNQALGDAGGPNPATANTSQVYVIRKGAPGEAANVFHLDAEAPAALALAENFQLRPRDVVYVDPVPLVQWNRIISLILPSAQTVDIGQDISNK